MTVSDQQVKSAQRYYDLDALRALAMFLGIVFHGAIFVLPEPVSQWPMHDENAAGDQTYRLIIDVIHGFRMPLFFLISGYFSALLWKRRSLRSLGIQRLKRIGIPFIVACLTVLPLSVGLLAVIADRRDPYDFSLWLLPLVWFESLAHLWFLWYLLVITAIFGIVVQYGRRFLHPAMWSLLLPASFLITMVMREPVFGADTADSLIPNGPVLTYYICFFLVGVFLYHRKIPVRRWWSVALIPAIPVFIFGYQFVERFIDENDIVLGDAPEALLYRDSLTLFGSLFEVTFAWLMCFGMMGVFRWIAARESYRSQYLSDSTYWMYLIHVPVVIAAQWLVIDWPISHHLKFVVVCVGVTAVVLVTYAWFVRYTFIGRTLNGPRTRPERPERSQKGVAELAEATKQ